VATERLGRRQPGRGTDEEEDEEDGDEDEFW
jgi:hypothetical protein